MSNKKIDFFNFFSYTLSKDKERITMKVSPNSLANLQKAPNLNERPDFKEVSAKGGIASGETKRHIKSMKEMMRILLEELDTESDIPNRTNLESVCLAQLRQAKR